MVYWYKSCTKVVPKKKVYWMKKVVESWLIQKLYKSCTKKVDWMKDIKVVEKGYRMNDIKVVEKSWLTVIIWNW